MAYITIPDHLDDGYHLERRNRHVGVNPGVEVITEEDPEPVRTGLLWADGTPIYRTVELDRPGWFGFVPLRDMAD